MPAPLQFVSAGQKIGRPMAAEKNAIIEAALAHKYNKARREPNDLTPPPESSLKVLVKNTTGNIINRGEVVALSSALSVSSDDNVVTDLVFDAGNITSTNIENRAFGILAEAAGNDGSLVEAYIGGVFPAKVKVQPGEPLYAKAEAGEPTLLTGADGQFYIIYLPGPTETGEDYDADNDYRWCIVTPAPSRRRPTAKYQFEQSIDDTLDPIWVSDARVQE